MTLEERERRGELTKREIHAKRKKHLRQVPDHLKNLYPKAYAGKSKVAAIKTFCYECVGWIREDALNCTMVTCPLYEVRPKSRIKLSDAKELAPADALSGSRGG